MSSALKNLILVCVAFFAIFSSQVAPEKSVETSELSSVVSPGQICKSILSKCPKFDADKFQSYVEKFNATQGPSEDEIKAAPKDPEMLLAAAEYFSGKTFLGPLGFQERINTMKKKDRRKLARTLFKFSKIETVSTSDFDDLLVQLYRLSHKPLGRWGAIRSSSNLLEAWDKLNDETIREHLELVVYSRGLQEAFSTIIDPSVGASALQLLKKNSGGVDTVVFATFWAVSIYLQQKHPEIAMPLLVQLGPGYLPSLSQFFKLYITDEESQILFTQGVEAAFDAVKARTKPMIQRGRYWKLARWTYMAVFSFLFIQALPQQNAQDRFQDTMTQLSESAAQDNLPPEALARGLFQQYLQIRKENGENADPNAPENQAKLKYFIQIERDAAEAVRQKKAH